MDSDAPDPPSRDEALEAAAAAVQGARATDRNAILEAQRVLHRAEKAHDRAVRDAVKRLRHEKDDTGAAEAALRAAHAERQGVVEARPLLYRVVGHLEGDEEVLDLVSGISTGHDGVMVLTSRRLLFLSPRQTLNFSFGEIEQVKIRGRRFGARATVVAGGAKNVVSGLSPHRAAEFARLLDGRVGRGVVDCR